MLKEGFGSIASPIIISDDDEEATVIHQVEKPSHKGTNGHSMFHEQTETASTSRKRKRQEPNGTDNNAANRRPNPPVPTEGKKMKKARKKLEKSQLKAAAIAASLPQGSWPTPHAGMAWPDQSMPFVQENIFLMHNNPGGSLATLQPQLHFPLPNNTLPAPSSSSWVTSMAVAGESQPDPGATRPSQWPLPLKPTQSVQFSSGNSIAGPSKKVAKPKGSAATASVVPKTLVKLGPIGMQPDPDPHSKHGAFFTASDNTQGSHVPNPSCTLVMERIPKHMCMQEFISTWSRKVSGTAPVYVKVNKVFGKALVEFPTAQLARKAWNSPRLGTDAQSKEAAIRVWWYRVVGVGASAGVGEIEEGEVVFFSDKKPENAAEQPPTVAKLTKKQRKAKNAKEREEKQKLFLNSSLSSTSLPSNSQSEAPVAQPIVQPLTSVDMSHQLHLQQQAQQQQILQQQLMFTPSAPFPPFVPDIMHLAAMAASGMSGMHGVSLNGMVDHFPYHNFTPPFPSDMPPQMQIPWRQRPGFQSQREAFEASVPRGATVETNTRSVNRKVSDSASVASSQRDSIGSSPLASEDQAVGSVAQVASSDNSMAFDMDMDMESPVSPKWEGHSFTESNPIMHTQQDGPASPLPLPFALSGHETNTVVERMDQVVVVDKPASTSSPHERIPSEPRAMKNAPTGPSFTQRSILARQQDLTERLTQSKKVLNQPEPIVEVEDDTSLSEKLAMEGRLRKLVLDSQRSKASLQARAKQATAASTPVLPPTVATYIPPVVAEPKLFPTPVKPTALHFEPSSFDDLAASFIADAIETSQPPYKVPVSQATVKQQLAAKQRKLELHIAESKALLEKLSLAKTKQEKDNIRAVMRERTRAIDQDTDSNNTPPPVPQLERKLTWPVNFQNVGIFEVSDDEDDDEDSFDEDDSS